MSELEEKLNSILNNPQQMGKIAEMAKSLMADGDKEEAEKSGGGASGISSLLSSLGGGAPDRAAMEKISRIMAQLSSGDDDKTTLLKAMEPYLSDKRRDKMDKAIKIARLAKLAGIAMEEMGEPDV